MTLLVQRWPRLSAIPHAPLGRFPTPLEVGTKLSAVVGAEVSIKRDDLTGELYGGNKVRKLEYLLGQALAEGADTIVTTGAVGSHHVLATALYGARHGFEVHGMLMPQVRTPHVEKNARAMLAAGATLHPISSFAMFPGALAALIAKLRLQKKRLFVIGPGGSDAAGVLGYVEAGLELGQQLLRVEVREPDAIYVALGTGGTAAGLAVGLAAAGVMAEIVAVRVTPRALIRKGMLSTLTRGLVQKLRGMTDRFPGVADIAMKNLTIEEGFLGEGYGIATGAGREAARVVEETEGLVLDGSYTGKTMAALIAHARGARRGQRLIYVHTLSSAPMQPLLEGAPPLPKRIEALMR
ncbi:MAG: pyridoxal-phosphate dependent enzyme [Myxococcota bacterium]|nr:pyridoxal-phosphate dependent enzyme [Myxococcota bacterium]